MTEYRSALIRWLVGLVFTCMAISLQAQDAQQASAWRQFEFDGKVISVNADTGIDGEGGYEILAEQNGLAVARLSVNRVGIMSDAWKTDLDKDGNFEVVVATGQLNGTNKGGVDIHEWDGYKFVSTRSRERIDAERASYDGHDQYKLVDGQLIREFPRFQNDAGTWVPSGETARYRYDMSSGEWTKL